MNESLIRHRRSLHRIPELDYDLPKTQAYVMNALAEIGLSPEPVAGSGVLAYIDAGKAETVALRSDMDALPIREETGAEYASLHEGRMHACGHDGHMAMLLAFAEYACPRRAEMKKNVLLVFQPAEEGGAGGKKVVESGALSRYGVRAAYAFHVAPEYPEGAIATKPGAFMARTTEMTIRVHGRATHAACASEGADALMASARFIVEAEAMERALDTDQMRLLKICSLHAGSAHNIVPGEATMLGTVRAFDDGLFWHMRRRLDEIAASLEREFGVKIEISCTDGYPPVLNDANLYEQTKSALAGMDFREMPAPVMIAEDFAFYQRAVPGIMMKLGVGVSEPLHASRFLYDERALETGLEAYRRLAF